MAVWAITPDADGSVTGDRPGRPTGAAALGNRDATTGSESRWGCVRYLRDCVASRLSHYGACLGGVSSLFVAE